MGHINMIHPVMVMSDNDYYYDYDNWHTGPDKAQCVWEGSFCVGINGPPPKRIGHFGWYSDSADQVKLAELTPHFYGVQFVAQLGVLIILIQQRNGQTKLVPH